MLGEEFDAFAESLDCDKKQALRINPLKTDVKAFALRTPFQLLSPVPWEKNAYYYPASERPGKHVLHEAGAYYLQEPSAMAVAGALDVQPGERVLDLCAAPGGKTTQLGVAMKGEGLLVANDVVFERAKVLSQNVERIGLSNAVVTNVSCERIAKSFPDFFDRILVDAPCSGEGMFRKNAEAIAQWSADNVEMCAARQKDILTCAAKCLRQGGRMVYSTCTFSAEENEMTVAWFLEEHEDFELIEPVRFDGFSRGRPEFANGNEELKKCVRLWPHKTDGEGHFFAVFQRKGEHTPAKNTNKPPRLSAEEKLFAELKKNLVSRIPQGTFACFPPILSLLPEPLNLNGLSVLRQGLALCELKKNRAEPDHALSHAIGIADAKNVLDLGEDEKSALAYIKGEELSIEDGACSDGWALVIAFGFALGWGKASGGRLKNHYPKGLRKTL